ncbi:NAD(P)H-hydrate epimerase [candidate division KSB1 bacterium]|nr:NAD(P)H-hydrate epimerase [candidate division KSB1 bacterium]
MQFPNISHHKIPALTTDQMREVDRLMIEEMGIQLIQMMENAGRNLARLAQYKYLQKDKESDIIVLAGKGGNGGGALVCARHLANWRYPVKIVLSKPEDEYTGIPLLQLNILKKMDLDIIPYGFLIKMKTPRLIIDGLIGYSLSGPPRGDVANLIRWANLEDTPILSLDLPSGMEATTGEVYVPFIKASATMTLALPKMGLLKPENKSMVGDLYLADISVPPFLYRQLNLYVPDQLFRDTEIIKLT